MYAHCGGNADPARPARNRCGRGLSLAFSARRRVVLDAGDATPLLNDVRELVSQQSLPCRAYRIVLSGTKNDVLANREGGGVHFLCRCGGALVVVHSHRLKILAE
jgi:hypothetical protein